MLCSARPHLVPIGPSNLTVSLTARPHPYFCRRKSTPIALIRIGDDLHLAIKTIYDAATHRYTAGFVRMKSPEKRKPRHFHVSGGSCITPEFELIMPREKANKSVETGGKFPVPFGYLAC